MGRRAVLGLVTVIAVVSAGVGWVAGQRIQSPAQVAAETAAPEPSLITVPVESVELSVDVIVRGTLEFSDTESIEVQPTTVDGTTIITRELVEVGDELNEGDVIIEVAGRPVFVLGGDLPEYRSLIPTADGPDVMQLEEALVRLGLDPGPVDGLYTSATEAAIEGLYQRAGYSASLPSADELAQLESLRDGVTEARQALADVQGGDDFNPSRSAIIRAEEALRQAKSTLVDAVNDQARLTSAAKTSLDAANGAEESTQAALATAKKRLNGARDGVHPDTGVAPTADELADLVEVRDAARVAWDEAIEAQDDAALVAFVTAVDQAEFVRLADVEVRIAEIDLADTVNPPSGGGQSTADLIARARESLADAEEALADADESIGTSFPAAEFRFLPTLPRTVQRIFAERGDSPTGPVMEVSGAGISITSSLSAVDRPLLTVGDTGIFDIEDLGIEIPLEITFLADDPGGGDLGDDRYRMRLNPVDDVVPEDAYGQNSRVTMPVGSTSGEVLAVPLAALSAGADGTSLLEVETSPGVTKFVKVTTGLKALGLIEVTPIEDDTLAEGDRVVVGRDNSGSSSSDSEQDG